MDTLLRIGISACLLGQEVRRTLITSSGRASE